MFSLDPDVFFFFIHTSSIHPMIYIGSLICLMKSIFFLVHQRSACHAASPPKSTSYDIFFSKKNSFQWKWCECLEWSHLWSDYHQFFSNFTWMNEWWFFILFIKNQLFFPFFLIGSCSLPFFGFLIFKFDVFKLVFSINQTKLE